MSQQTTVWLGARSFDVTRRPLIVHKLAWAGEAVVDAADAIEVDAMAGIDDIARLATNRRRPVVVTCHGDCGPPADVGSFDRLAMAGVSAVALTPQPESDLEALAAGIAEAGVSVVVDAHGHDWGPERAEDFVMAATAAGIGRDRLVVDAIGVVSDADAAGLGVIAAGLIAGAPLVRTANVRAARRVAEVVGRLQAARVGNRERADG